jgi:hypothetical protein
MDKKSLILSGIVVAFVGLGVYSNIMEQSAQDRSKIPPKVEESRGFQRWITNLKNKDINIAADDFTLLEENEIYNAKWLKVSSLDEPGKQEEFEQFLESHRNIERVIFSPSERELIDFRNIERDGFASNQVHFYGQKEDKIIDARILDCSLYANCYFDRAYFLTNDVFVITEISRAIHKKDVTSPPCGVNDMCSYSFKLHLVDLINNSRLVYESTAFDAVLSEVLPDL